MERREKGFRPVCVQGVVSRALVRTAEGKEGGWSGPEPSAQRQWYKGKKGGIVTQILYDSFSRVMGGEEEITL